MKSRQLSDTFQQGKVLPDESAQNPLAGVLLDLYVAMVIVIPLAFALKMLWE